MSAEPDGTDGDDFACFYEGAVSLGEAGDWRAQETLWGMIHQGDFEIVFQGEQTTTSGCEC